VPDWSKQKQGLSGLLPQSGIVSTKPLERAAVEISELAEAEPDLTTRQLLQRLQARYPGSYPDGQLRTLQRRLKIWRGQIAHELILSTSAEANSAGQHAAP
jgi:hypothetical protein